MKASGRRLVAGLCAFCVVAWSGIATGTAAAAPTGTTAFTCSSSAATKTFSDADCRTGGGSSFGHVAVAEKEQTELSFAGGLTKIHSVISGVEVEFQSTELTGSGLLENMASGEEHTANWTGVLELKTVTVTKPVGKGCLVKGGEVKSKELKGTTAGKGMGLVIEPTGTLITEFTVEGCSIAALNGKYEVKGSVTGTPEGATFVTTAAGTTAQETFKLRGQNMGIDGSITFSARGKGSGGAYTALSMTTTNPEEDAATEKANTEEAAKTKEEKEAAAIGTTAFTCSSSAATKTFSDADCRTGGGSSFGHVAVAEKEQTELSFAGGLTKVHSVISGVEVEFQSTELTGSGLMENMVLEKEHTANGTGVLDYKNVTVTKPVGKGCVVKGGEVETKKLKATTAGQGMGLKFEPNEGTQFAEFTVEGCSVGFLNGKWEAKGSVIGTPEGANVVTTAAGTTTQETLKLNGQRAGIDGSITVSGRAKGSGGAYTALGATTKST